MNEEAAKLMIEIARLMQLNDENPFKVQAFQRAVDIVERTDDLEERAKAGTLTELEGVGKGIEEVLSEFLLKGTCKVRDELKAALPKGLLELVRIRGLGPKKAKRLIDELGVRSLSALVQACESGKVTSLKGFGAKEQERLLDGAKRLIEKANEK